MTRRKRHDAAFDRTRGQMEIVPGAEIEITDAFTEADRIELTYRGRLSIENAETQLGWSPRYRSVRDGITDHVERYRAFLATQR